MPFYAFEAFDSMGKPATGRIEAVSQEEATAKIRHELKLFAMKVEETTETGKIEKTVLEHKVPADDRARAFRPNPEGPTIYDPDKPVDPPKNVVTKAPAEVSFSDAVAEQTRIWQPFGREELQALRERALDLCNVPHTNPMWKLAYYELARAADHVDAMIARTEI